MDRRELVDILDPTETRELTEALLLECFLRWPPVRDEDDLLRFSLYRRDLALLISASKNASSRQ